MYARIALGNVRRSIKDFGIYFLTLVLGVAVYYAFNSVTQQSAVLRLSTDMRTLVRELGMVIGGVSVFVAVLLAFLVLFGNRFLIRRRKREFAIYLTLGMDRRHVSGIVAMESLAVGAGALVVGLAVGVLLSQALLYATARLFNTHVTGFGLMFSGQACAYTVMSFAIIFLVVGALNVLEVSRFRLIDLMNADRKGEKSLVRNLPLSVALFVVSLALIGVAYHELRVNGMYAIDWRFNLATALVSVGTFLLFFSVSGFLLRLGQSARGFYLRGLNMFALRQLSSRVNSAWVSISIVCAALFLAITSTCGGFAIVSSINQSVSAITHYDVSIAMYSTAQTSHASDADDVSGSGKEALLKASVPDWDSLVADSARIDLYQDPSMRLNLKALRGDTGVALPDSFAKYTNGLDKVPIYVVSLSQYNAILALRGDKPATLKANEALVTTDMNNMVSFWQRVALKREGFDFLGTAMRLRARSTTMEYQNSVNTSVGTIVVPDAALESKRAQLEPRSSLLNVKAADSRAEARLYKEVVKAHSRACCLRQSPSPRQRRRSSASPRSSATSRSTSASSCSSAARRSSPSSSSATWRKARPAIGCSSTSAPSAAWSTTPSSRRSPRTSCSRSSWRSRTPTWRSASSEASSRAWACSTSCVPSASPWPSCSCCTEATSSLRTAWRAAS